MFKSGISYDGDFYTTRAAGGGYGNRTYPEIMHV